MKWAAWVTGTVLLASLAGAQQIPQVYVQNVLQARTVAVIVYAGSQQPVEDPQENERARLAVQTAILKWGRYQITQDTNLADLIIAVRKGRAQGTAASGAGNPPVVLDPDSSGINIHMHGGRNPDNPPLSQTEPPQASPRPRIGGAVSSGEDLFRVYRGRGSSSDTSGEPTQFPLDQAPVWSYLAKDGLQPPKIEAVARFRKAVEAAEQSKP